MTERRKLLWHRAEHAERHQIIPLPFGADRRHLLCARFAIHVVRTGGHLWAAEVMRGRGHLDNAVVQVHNMHSHKVAQKQR